MVIYFHFLACGYCIAHSPRLYGLTNEYPTSEVIVFAISISTSDSDYKLTYWRDTYNYDSWIIGRDNNSVFRNFYNITGSPTTVFINSAGNMTTKLVGLQEKETLNSTLLATLGA